MISNDQCRTRPLMAVRRSLYVILLLLLAGCARLTEAAADTFDLTPSVSEPAAVEEVAGSGDGADVAAGEASAVGGVVEEGDGLAVTTALPTLTSLPSATASPTASPTVTPSPTASNTPTITPSPTETTVPSPTSTPTPNPDAELEYEVVAGDTPGGIAMRYGISVAELMAYNGIEDPRHLAIGATIRIPVGERRVEAMRATATAVAEATVAAVADETAIIEALPEQVTIDLPHAYQRPNNCAPATTAMVLAAYGLEKTQYDMAAIQKPVPNDVNVTAEEVAASINEMGLRAYVGYNGDILLLERLLAAGFPIMTEEWMSYDGGMGHFRAIRGYDRANQRILHNDSYYGPNIWRSYDEVMRDWAPFHFKYVIPYRADQEDLLRRIIGPNWNRTTMYENLRDSMVERVNANPNNGYAWWGLGEAQLRLGNPAEAVASFERAINTGTLPWRYMWYHYGYLEALNATGRYEATIATTDSVLASMARSEDVRYHRARALIALGRTDEAIVQLQRALEENPRFSPAQILLNELGA
jgi:tetratricopeptide (TPR) repeat protein/LysM repeat protein